VKDPRVAIELEWTKKALSTSLLRLLAFKILVNSYRILSVFCILDLGDTKGFPYLDDKGGLGLPGLDVSGLEVLTPPFLPVDPNL
jgi:hypothetical protein